MKSMSLCLPFIPSIFHVTKLSNVCFDGLWPSPYLFCWGTWLGVSVPGVSCCRVCSVGRDVDGIFVRVSIGWEVGDCLVATG